MLTSHSLLCQTTFSAEGKWRRERQRSVSETCTKTLGSRGQQRRYTWGQQSRRCCCYDTTAHHEGCEVSLEVDSMLCNGTLKVHHERKGRGVITALVIHILIRTRMRAHAPHTHHTHTHIHTTHTTHTPVQ